MNSKKSSLPVSGIYKIENKINGKYYIGSSNNITGTTGRWKEHINGLNANRHENDYLQKSWNKYGSSNFRFLILEQVPKVDLLSVEQRYLDEARKDGKKCYNLSFLASSGGFAGHKHTEESKQKTSAKLKGRISPNKGKKHPELCGNGNPNANLTVFCFRNIKSGETFVGNQHDFSQKFNLIISAINPMIHGRHKTSQGWTIH